MRLPARLRLPFLAVLLGLSGACALAYQTAWLREFRLVFGGATPAAAAVLAVFMGGLGVGSAWFGRRAEQSPNPLRLYGLVEAGVGVSALLAPLLLALVRRAYVATGGTMALGLGPATLLQLLLAVLVLGPPCVLMGGSLPAAFKWAETDDDRQRGALGVLYGLNTLGAVAGVLLGTFYTLEHWGIRATVVAAAFVNLAIGAAALWVSRGELPAAGKARAKEQAAGEAATPTSPRPPRRFVYAAAAVTGFTFFLVELVWFRLLAPLVGSSVYGFGLVLAVALAGMGLGSLWYRQRFSVRAGSVTAGALAVVAGLEAVALAIPLALGDRLALFALDLGLLRAWGLAGQLTGWTLVVVAIVFLPALLAGVQFPLLVGLLGEGSKDAGRHVGLAYAANTAGAIAGALLGGFVLLPVLTAPGAWRLTVLLTVALSVGASVAGRASVKARHWALQAALVAAAAWLVVVPDGPGSAWRHEAIGYGRIISMPTSVNGLRAWLSASARSVLEEHDGREASIALAASDDGDALLNNGKSDGAAFGDAATQVMLGLLPALLHPAPHSAFVVGLGTGTTAGWLGAVPGMERVDVVEVEPAVVELARGPFAPVNHDVMNDPRVHVAIGDAREALLVSGPSYDLIVSEPSNPYRAGVATLFTREYYEAVKSRLAPGGIFAQWLQGYEVDSKAVQLVYATLASVFPHVETWVTKPSDLVFVCHLAPPAYPLAELERRAAQPPFAEAMARVWYTGGAYGLLAHHLASPALTAQLAAPEVLNTDDRNLLEYGFATAILSGHFSPSDLAELADGVGADVPAHLASQLDRVRLHEERLVMLAAHNRRFELSPDEPVDDARRRAEAIEASARGQSDRVLAAWVGEPVNVFEQLMLLDAAAQTGTAEQVEAYAQPLVTQWPADVLFARAWLAARLGDQDGAMFALRDGLRALRTQRWTRPKVVAAVLDKLIEPLTGGRPSRAELFLELLAQPFDGGLDELARQDALIALGPHLPLARQADVARRFEPHPPWTRAFLRFRVDAYRAAGDPHLAAAEADLSAFEAAEDPGLTTTAASPPR